MIKILIADDHAIFREGLKQVLTAVEDIIVIAEAASRQEIPEAIKNTDPDVAIVDITMPVQNSIEMLKELKRCKQKLPVLVLSRESDKYSILPVLRTGADGYLTKESAPNDLISAIRTVYSGRKYISSCLVAELVSQPGPVTAKPPHEMLSKREYQIMCRLAICKPAKEIADKLSLSVKTVHTYRGIILEKMGLKSSAELTHYAIRNQLVDLKADSLS